MGGGGEAVGDGGEDEKDDGGGEGTEWHAGKGHVRAPCGKFLLQISQNIHVVFVSLLTSMTESSKPNVQSVCEKTGQTAPPMPVIAPGTTVSLIWMDITC